VGTKITLKVNGQIVARGEDPALADGGFGLMWQRDEPLTIPAVEVLNLDREAAGSPPAASGTSGS
jgi:hypothetical protein